MSLDSIDKGKKNWWELVGFHLQLTGDMAITLDMKIKHQIFLLELSKTGKKMVMIVVTRMNFGGRIADIPPLATC